LVETPILSIGYFIKVDFLQLRRLSILIGVYIPGILETSGGAYSYTTRTITAIQDWEKTQKDVKFLFLASSGPTFSFSRNDDSFKTLTIHKNGFQNFARRILFKLRSICGIYSFEFPITSVFEDLNIDFLWCLGPIEFIPTIPFAVTVWDVEHRRTPYFPEYLNGQWEYREQNNLATIRRSAFVITGTMFTAQLIEKYYGIELSMVCISPFPVENLKGNTVITGLKSNFLYPAQFWPHKNHLNLIRGFALALEKSDVELKLILSGGDKGFLKVVKAEVDRLGITKNVIFPGFVSEEELHNFYLECATVIYPSIFGPDNLPPLEGISHGCNVYVANIPGARDVYGDRVGYFDPFDILSISRVFLESSNQSVNQVAEINNFGSNLLCEPGYSVNEVVQRIKLLEPYIRTWKPSE
jgi:glycosyltransferase involved in cell wall biosynthesis